MLQTVFNCQLFGMDRRSPIVTAAWFRRTIMNNCFSSFIINIEIDGYRIINKGKQT